MNALPEPASSLRAPWVKRIDLTTGAATVVPLDAAEPLVTRRTNRETHFFEFDGHSWYHVGSERRWTIHGTTASSDDALFTFMEFPEARHPQLESTLVSDAGSLFVYADWLEEQGDPFAAALNPQLLKAQGPAGHWFLEGLDRSGRLEFTIRDGLVRAVKLGGVPERTLAHTLHRLCHLRACVALEHVSMQRPANVHELGPGLDARSPLWRVCRWPPSLQRLTVSGEAADREALAKDLKVVVTDV